MITVQNKNFYYVPEAAKMLNLSESSVRQYIRANKLEHVKAYGRVLITEDSIRPLMRPVLNK